LLIRITRGHQPQKNLTEATLVYWLIDQSSGTLMWNLRLLEKSAPNASVRFGVILTEAEGSEMYGQLTKQ